MEATGGVSLLDRGRRGVTPTRSGEALAHHARLVLRQVGAMQGELSEHARGIRGYFRILGNSAAITEFLPDRLGTFLGEHRRIDIDLAERPSPEIVKAVAGGLAEIGIVSDAVQTGALETAPFAIDRLVVVMARTHPMASSRRIAFDQMPGEDQIAFSGALQRYIDEQAQQAGHRMRYRVRLQTFEGICRMAAMGAGVGIVPETAARRARRIAPIAIICLSNSWATRRLVLC
ncbi:MAG TPA: LysR substrate-binding domain-containing protein [Sphingomonas sp.]|nr:LysR substrate-binding domain-containing protein [Sphingomonas sp.]